MSGNQPTSIKTTVTFAAAEKPYHHDFAPTTPISVVLDAALAAFEITIDGTSRYYLLHDGVELSPTSTLSNVADHAHAVHLRLRTETTQGCT
jgi:hypothetical protein